jgi:2-polyprenyl-3-methyl-5-hydroxy-6-metoxy-1,4-benzoquinol methylase
VNHAYRSKALTVLRRGIDKFVTCSPRLLEYSMYDSINQAVLAEIPDDARTFLDLGCGGGSLGAFLKKDPEKHVVGVTVAEDEATLARSRLDRVEIHDLNGFDPKDLGRFDCIICSHVLEHLYHPGQLLERLHNCVTTRGRLIVALPNILFWKQRLRFLGGEFRYSQGGVMDETHYRFYDWWTARELLTTTGYRIEASRADGGFPMSRMLGRRFRATLDQTALVTFPGLFGWQFVFRCALAATNADR